MIQKILLASDFTGITSNAERYAMDIARATKASVTILHAVEPIADSEGDSAVERFLDTKKIAAEKSGEALAAQFRKEGIDCTIQVAIGKRWKIIVDTASAAKFDLVILGAHKIHDGDKVYLGTTTHKVFFAAHLPLLVVPAE